MIRPAESFEGFLKTQPREFIDWVTDFLAIISEMSCFDRFGSPWDRDKVTDKMSHSGWFWNSEKS